MERRDYFMDQIKQLGRVLGMILSSILKLKNAGKSDEIIKYVENTFRDELKLDLQNMADLSEEQFISRIIQEKKLSDEGLETMADIFYELGEIQESVEFQEKYLIRSLFIFEYLSNNSQTYSLSWIYKIKKIKEVLNQS